MTDPRVLLLTPHGTLLTVTPQLRIKIAAYLVTAFGVQVRDVKKLIPNTLKQWGRLQISAGGDLIHARGYHKLRSDGRDASFVRVSFSPVFLSGESSHTGVSTSS